MRLLIVPLTLTGLLLAGCGGAATGAETTVCAPVEAAALVPDDGAWLGAHLDAEGATLDSYASTLGQRPAVVGTAVEVPMRSDDRAQVNALVDKLVDARGILLLTLEPYQGSALQLPPLALAIEVLKNAQLPDGRSCSNDFYFGELTDKFEVHPFWDLLVTGINVASSFWSIRHNQSADLWRGA